MAARLGGSCRRGRGLHYLRFPRRGGPSSMRPPRYKKLGLPPPWRKGRQEDGDVPSKAFPDKNVSIIFMAAICEDRKFTPPHPLAPQGHIGPSCIGGRA